MGAGTRRHRRGDVGAAERVVLGVTWPPLLALLLGSERADRPDDLLTGAALPVSIPMTGTAQSLNLAVAVGVLLHEMRRRTRPAQR